MHLGDSLYTPPRFLKPYQQKREGALASAINILNKKCKTNFCAKPLIKNKIRKSPHKIKQQIDNDNIKRSIELKSMPRVTEKKKSSLKDTQ